MAVPCPGVLPLPPPSTLSPWTREGTCPQPAQGVTCLSPRWRLSRVSLPEVGSQGGQRWVQAGGAPWPSERLPVMPQCG